MTEFIALRPERVAQIITAWAAVRWPLKERHAAHLFAQTGFMPDRHGTHAFRSELCPVADSFFISNGKHVQSAHVALSTIATPDQYGRSAPLTQSVYLTYAQIIDARTGAKRGRRDRTAGAVAPGQWIEHRSWSQSSAGGSDSQLPRADGDPRLADPLGTPRAARVTTRRGEREQDPSPPPPTTPRPPAPAQPRRTMPAKGDGSDAPADVQKADGMSAGASIVSPRRAPTNPLPPGTEPDSRSARPTPSAGSSRAGSRDPPR